MNALCVLSVGDSAERLLAAANAARVSARCIAKFQRCVYLEFKSTQVNGLICVASAEIPRGPITVNCTEDTINALLLTLSTSRDVAVQPDMFSWLDTCVAIVWPSRLTLDAPIFVPETRWLQALMSLSGDDSLVQYCDEFWSGEAGRSRLGTASITREPGTAGVGMEAAEHHYFATTLRQTKDALEQLLATSDPEQCLRAGLVDPLLKLAGAGRGMTPAGDDALAGIFIALHLLSRYKLIAALRECALPEITNRTHPVSSALLDEALSGRTDESVHRLLLNMSHSQLATVQQSATLLTGMGQTSGWDFLVGMLVVFSAISPERRLPTSTLLPSLHA
ncbi:MAG: DUF2877 domain-containing protein [Granulosicoccus sp.]|nr:DUF2877 domain-containing protein [Granulosicoccus sp.]